MQKRRKLIIGAAGAALALTAAGTTAPAAGHGDDDDNNHRGELKIVVDTLQGPRGVDALGDGRTLVTEIDGTFSLVVERRGSARVIELGQLDTGFSPAIAAGRHGTIWLLTGGAPPDAGGAPPPGDPPATLFKWRRGWDEPRPVADIAAYQETDPDPFNVEGPPDESNPFGLAVLWDGSVLVADAAGNDLLRVSKHGHIKTVARFKPRTVKVPEGLPGAGTRVRAESVSTSVTVGKDGYWYVGELRGFPATPRTSQIWRIKPGTTNAVCDPGHPWRRPCKRFADGLTSIVDLGAGHKGIYAVTLSKQSWLAIEGDPPAPGSEIGGLFLVRKRHHEGGTRKTELVPNQLVLPSGVDIAGKPYVVGPIFPLPAPPGALMKIVD